MGRPRDYSSPQRQGRKVPQVHRLRPFVMLTPYPKSAACTMARHKHFPENFQGVVIPLHLNPLSHHTRRQSLLPNSMHNSHSTIQHFLASGKWMGNVGCSACALKMDIKDVFVSVIFFLFHAQILQENCCIAYVVVNLLFKLQRMGKTLLQYPCKCLNCEEKNLGVPILQKKKD